MMEISLGVSHRYILILAGKCGDQGPVEARSQEKFLKFTTPYPDVLLDDNQVLSSQPSSPTDAHPVLTDVCYIKSDANPQTNETKSVLMKRDNELHETTCPTDQLRHSEEL
jgi:hypothetical protein